MNQTNRCGGLLSAFTVALVFGCAERSDTAGGSSNAGQPVSTQNTDVEVGNQPISRSRAAQMSEPTDGTKRMATILRELAQKADPKRNPTIGPKVLLVQLRDKLARESRPGHQINLRSQIAFQLLVDGQTEEALNEYQKVEQKIDELQLSKEHSFYWTLRELIAIANLRLAEQQNCIAHHNSESCIMPIQGGGIHKLRQGALAARAEFARKLMRNPNDTRSIWLLNLTHMILGEYPAEVPSELLIPPEAFQSQYDIGRFTDVAAVAGVDTVGLSGGVIVDDFDSDGFLDVMVSDWGNDRQLRLYTNHGDGSFADITGYAGLTGEVGGLNLVQADYDNDGHVDVFVLRGAWLGDEGQHPNSLLRNLGDGRFDDVTQQAGLLSYCPTHSAAWADYNLDGWIDLFVGNETFRSQKYPCQLFRNNGDGTFTDVAWEVGLAHFGRVKGAAWGDVDNDGYPDLYVSQFGQPNVLFHNEGPTNRGWQFKDVTTQANVAEPKGSFPTWFWDYDNDGWNDILVAPFSGFKFDGTALKTVVAEYLDKPTSADRIHLYRNNRDGSFSNVASELGLDAPLLAMGANFGDLDNDGFLDCYFGTGDPHFATLVPNRMFRNAAGKAFQDVTTSGGFGHIQKGHGIGFGDFDNDGDQDIYTVMGGAYAGDVYQNLLFENPGHGNHWITLRLQGHGANRSAIGARIRITVRDAAGYRDIYSTVNSGGSFGASSLQQEIGLGDASAIAHIEIQWPRNGSVQTIANVAMDRVYQIREGDVALTAVLAPSFKFSEGVSENVDHGHP